MTTRARVGGNHCPRIRSDNNFNNECKYNFCILATFVAKIHDFASQNRAGVSNCKIRVEIDCPRIRSDSSKSALLPIFSGSTCPRIRSDMSSKLPVGRSWKLCDKILLRKICRLCESPTNSRDAASWSQNSTNCHLRDNWKMRLQITSRKPMWLIRERGDFVVAAKICRRRARRSWYQIRCAKFGVQNTGLRGALKRNFGIFGAKFERRVKFSREKRVFAKTGPPYFGTMAISRRAPRRFLFIFTPRLRSE